MNTSTLAPDGAPPSVALIGMTQTFGARRGVGALEGAFGAWRGGGTFEGAFGAWRGVGETPRDPTGITVIGRLMASHGGRRNRER